MIPEAFRCYPGAIRSLHPSHSVAAIGPAATWLIEDHEKARTPCGSGTPYLKALDRDCQIVFLGVGLESNTCFHTIEAIADLPYLLNQDPDQFTIVDERGRSSEISIFRHRAGVSRRFKELEGLLGAEGILRSGRVGRARVLVIKGASFREFMIDRIRANPGILLARSQEAADQ
jgi:aminoglycoside 3-N-acetyltransferase